MTQARSPLTQKERSPSKTIPNTQTPPQPPSLNPNPLIDNDKVKICDYKTDLIFYERNPQMLGRKISSAQSSLANEWSGIRRNIRGCQ